MKLHIKIQSLNYGDLAVKALPILKNRVQSRDAVARLVMALCDLPELTIRQVLDAIPEEEKRGIAAQLVQERQADILSALQKLAEKKKLRAKFQAISLGEDLTAVLTVQELDFDSLGKTLAPYTEQGSLAVQLLGKVSRSGLVRGLLHHTSQQKKESTAAALLNHASPRLCRALSGKLHRKNLRITFSSITAEA